VSKKRVVISACLLGELCRYDGKTKKIKSVVEAFKEYEIIPFCPEAPLFGTPRERISVVEIEDEHRIITDESKRDVTQQLKNEILSFIKKNQDIDAIVLKSKSPSCGKGTTPILNTQGDFLSYGNGIAVDMFESFYEGIEIIDEVKCL